MTLDELIAREAIRHTLATYNKAGDANDADGFAECFTIDAIMDAPSFRHEGREAIRTWKASRRISAGSSGKTARFRIHHISSIHIDLLSIDTAHTRTAWLVITDIGPDHSGLYHDDFTRDGDRWLIRKRVVDTLWRAHNSYIGPEVLGCRSGLVQL